MTRKQRKLRKITRAAAMSTILPGMFVLTVVFGPAASTECRSSRQQAMAIAVDQHAAGGQCLPLDWVDKTHLVTPS